jgi:ribosomal protein S18 acetylase RimI-like enzyme
LNRKVSENRKHQVEYVHTDGNVLLLEEARQLFLQYARSLNVDLSFQNFDQELKELPERYGPPDGTVIIACINGTSAGCVALHRLSDGICEMKRLYVRDEFRGFGIGKELIAMILMEASKRHYKYIRLDTLPNMGKAQILYESFGFYDIHPYVFNPIPGTRFLERKLD